MDYKKFARCIECKKMVKIEDIVHIKDFGFYCKSCYDKNKEVFGVIIEFDKYKR